MLGTLREYATEHLESEGELQTARKQHAEYMFAQAMNAVDEFLGPDQRLWLERAAADHDNLRAALTWATEHDPELAVRLSSALWRFWEIRGFLLEGQAWIARALAARGDIPDQIGATALNNLGNLTYRVADYARARDLYERSVVISRSLNELRGVADGLNNLGLVAGAQGDYDAARRFMRESVALRRHDDRPERLSLGLHNFAEMEIDAGNPGPAVPLLGEALELRERRGDDRGAAYVRYNLGRAAVAQGSIERGRAELQRALAAFREVDEKIGLADTPIESGLLALDRGDGAEAVASLSEGFRLRIELGDKRGVLSCLEAVARVAASRRNEARAARLLGAAGQQRQMLHIPPTRTTQAWLTTVDATVRRALGSTAYAVHRERGASMTLTQAIDEAFAELARDLPSRGQVEPARHESAPLTARERDVLRLLAQGLADREIAAELSISPRTASTHVTNILRKLGETSRTAAAAYAVRHQVV